MFENLIESGSHSADLKRKGSFLAGFAIFYLILCGLTSRRYLVGSRLRDQQGLT